MDWGSIFGSDDPNERTLMRFLTRVSVAAGLVYLLPPETRLAWFWMFMAISAFVAFATAVLRAEPFADGPLNSWDEAAGFTALMVASDFFLRQQLATA